MLPKTSTVRKCAQWSFWRLATPLVNEPITRGQLGILILAGSEDILDFVNAFLEKERASGRLDELAEDYIRTDKKK